MRKLIRLTESDLHKIVKESVNRILKESGHEWWREEDWNPNYTSDDDEETDNDKVDRAYDDERERRLMKK
jgi:hypothetical protein